MATKEASVGDLLDMEGISQLTGLTRSTINHHRFEESKSPFPKPLQIPGNSPIWQRSDVEKWMQTRDSKRGRAGQDLNKSA